MSKNMDISEIKKWAFSQPISAAYVKKDDNGNWRRFSGKQPKDLVLLIHVAFGKKPSTMGIDYKALLHPFLKRIVHEKKEIANNLSYFNHAHFRSPSELRKFKQGNDNTFSLNPWVGFMVFRKDNKDSLIKTSILSIVHHLDKKKKEKFDKKFNLDIAGLDVAILIGLCLGYKKYDIMAYHSTPSQINNVEKRNKRIQEFEVKWKRANEQFEQMSNDKEVLEIANFILNKSILVSNIYEKFNNEEEIEDNIFKHGYLNI